MKIRKMLKLVSEVNNESLKWAWQNSERRVCESLGWFSGHFLKKKNMKVPNRKTCKKLKYVSNFWKAKNRKKQVNPS